MNLALQPRNITARVVLVAGCLHVSVSSDRLLKQATLVEFTRQGLLRLESPSIQWVRIYGLKTGQELPVWSEEFTINSSNVNAADANGSDPDSLSFDRSNSHRTNSDPTPNTNDNIADADLTAQEVASQSTTYFRRAVQLLPSIDPSKCLMAVSAIAFLSGGTIGLVTRASRSERVAAAPDQAQRQQQAEAKRYLRKMNQAQQAFYKQHQRFASSLEELERSAALISQSYHYTYKLTLPSKTQSQITATAKTEGLNSYTAAVFVATSGAAPGAAIASICETQQPSKLPPVLQLIGDTASCVAPAKAL